MDAAVGRVATVLRELGASGDVTELPEPVPTAAAAAAQLGCDVGAIANSLVFSADGAPVLVVTSGAHRVDTKRLADLMRHARSSARTQASCCRRPAPVQHGGNRDRPGSDS